MRIVILRDRAESELVIRALVAYQRSLEALPRYLRQSDPARLEDLLQREFAPRPESDGPILEEILRADFPSAS